MAVRVIVGFLAAVLVVAGVLIVVVKDAVIAVILGVGEKGEGGRRKIMKKTNTE